MIAKIVVHRTSPKREGLQLVLKNPGGQNPDLVLTPWQDRLYAGIADAQHEVLIASPYIKFGIATKIRGASRNPDVKFRTITRFKETDFAAGACDVDAVWALSQIGGGTRYEAKYNNTLHSKIYIIDARIAYLGSSNLTFSGLMRNQEACVLFKDSDFVRVLRQHFLALWEDAEPLTRESFVAMIAILASATTRPPREVEHFYPIERRMDFFNTVNPTWRESSIEYTPSYPDELASRIFRPLGPVSPLPHNPQSAHQKIPHPVGEIPAQLPHNSAAALGEQAASTTSKVRMAQLKTESATDLKGAHLPDDAILSDNEALLHQQLLDRISAKRTFTERVDQAAGTFFRSLRTRFELSVDGFSNLYVLVICGPDFLPRLEVNPGDLDSLTGNHLDFKRILDHNGKYGALLSVGKLAYQCACFVAAHKAGLISRFGSQVVFLVSITASRRNFLADYWNQNFLGPLITIGEDEAEPAEYNNAVFRLLGAISISEGLERAVDIAEEFFNPLDPIGENIVDLRFLKDAKTALQEIAQVAGRMRPSYQNSFAGGPPHKPVWNSEVWVGDTIRALGTGSSKGEAEMSAATAALDDMEELKGWQSALAAAREESLKRYSLEARFAIEPKRELSSRMRTFIVRLLMDRLAVEVDPDYAMLALRARLPGEQSPGRLSYDNRALAALGAILSEWIAMREIWETDYTKNNSLLKLIIMGMPDMFDVNEIRRQMGLPGAISTAQQLDVAQAIVAAHYMTVGAGRFRSTFSSVVQRLMSDAIGVLTRTQVAKTNRGRIDVVQGPFDAMLSYTTFLQEETQARNRIFPAVSYKTTGPSNQAIHEATVVFDELKASASAASRVEARNKASYEVLRLLYERDRQSL